MSKPLAVITDVMNAPRDGAWKASTLSVGALVPEEEELVAEELHPATAPRPSASPLASTVRRRTPDGPAPPGGWGDSAVPGGPDNPALPCGPDPALPCGPDNPALPCWPDNPVLPCGWNELTFIRTP